jgi:histone deacetylase complex regulatory component SIN3
VVSIFSKKAKYEDVLLEREAVKFHYDRHTKGQRDTLAIQCFQFIESKIFEGSEQAKEIKAEVYKR